MFGFFVVVDMIAIVIVGVALTEPLTPGPPQCTTWRETDSSRQEALVMLVARAFDGRMSRFALFILCISFKSFDIFFLNKILGGATVV